MSNPSEQTLFHQGGLAAVKKMAFQFDLLLRILHPQKVGHRDLDITLVGFRPGPIAVRQSNALP